MALQRGDGETALRLAHLEPDEGNRRFELAIAQYARGDHKAADAALADLIANGRDRFAYQMALVYAVRGEKNKLSSGCKSLLIITTPARSASSLIRCCGLARRSPLQELARKTRFTCSVMSEKPLFYRDPRFQKLREEKQR